MATILLAVGSRILREACRTELIAAGHAPFTIDRPLAVLAVQSRVRWAAVVVDASDLGREAMAALSPAARIIGLGLEAPGAASGVALPLSGEELLARVEVLATEPGPSGLPAFAFDPGRRVVRGPGGSVRLSRVQARLLRELVERTPEPAAAADLVRTVWGYAGEDEASASQLVRAHVRNLRAKLAPIDLQDLIRSARGRGYSIELPHE